MGWGRSTKRPRRYRVEEQPQRCHQQHLPVACVGLPTHWCIHLRDYVCAVHARSLPGGVCCIPLKVGPIYNSPLQKLGSWVFANKHSISGAPEDLLLAAYAHVEVRMIRCAHGSARARATERWLGRWAKIIDRELEVQRYIAAYRRRVVGVALNSAPAGGLVEVELVL